MHNTSLSRPATLPRPIPAPSRTPAYLRDCAHYPTHDLRAAARRPCLAPDTPQPERVIATSADTSLAFPSAETVDTGLLRLIARRNQLFQETVTLAHLPLPQGHHPQRAHDQADRLATAIQRVRQSDEAVLECLDPDDPETGQIRLDLATSADQLQAMVRLYRIAATEVELGLLGVRFEPGALGQLNLQNCGTRIPWNQLIALIELHMEGNNPADAELGAQMLARLAPRIVPGDPSTRELASKLVQLANGLSPRLRQADRGVLDAVMPLLLPLSREALSRAIHDRVPALIGRGTIECVLQTLTSWPVLLHHLVIDRDATDNTQSSTHTLLARLLVDEFRHKIGPDMPEVPFCLRSQIERIDQATSHLESKWGQYVADRRFPAGNSIFRASRDHWEETTLAVDLLQFLADPQHPEGPAPGPDGNDPFLSGTGPVQIT